MDFLNADITGRGKETISRITGGMEHISPYAAMLSRQDTTVLCCKVGITALHFRATGSTGTKSVNASTQSALHTLTCIGVAYVYASFDNTFVHVTDLHQDIIRASSWLHEMARLVCMSQILMQVVPIWSLISSASSFDPFTIFHDNQVQCVMTTRVALSAHIGYAAVTGGLEELHGML